MPRGRDARLGVRDAMGDPVGTTLLLEQFEVTETSKKFEKVTRLHCRLCEDSYDLKLDLDINSDLYPLEANDRFTLLLTSTLAIDGQPTGRNDTGPSLLDQYDYAMHGKIYKWKQENTRAPIEVHVSYGGLLMRLKGDARHLQKLTLDARVYLLLRKTVERSS